MGNILINSFPKKYPVYYSQSADYQWQFPSQNNQNQSIKLVRNRNDRQVLGQFFKVKQVGNIEKSLKIAQFRKDFRNQGIVGLYGIYEPSEKQLSNAKLCGFTNNYSVVVEHIVYCLSDLGQISFQNSINIMKNLFKGAMLVKQNLNILTIYDENMIFFNSLNQCKIWINSNITSNYSEYQHNQTKQIQTVNSIFQAVQQKISYSLSFQKYFRLKCTSDISSLKQAFIFLNQFQEQQIKLIKNKQQTNLLNINSLSLESLNESNQTINNNKKDQTGTNLSFNHHKKSLSYKKISGQRNAILTFSEKKKYPNQKIRDIKTISVNQFQSGSYIKQPQIKKLNKQTMRIQKCLKDKQFIQDRIPIKNDNLSLKYPHKSCLMKQRLSKQQIKPKFIQSNRSKNTNSYSKPYSNISTNHESIQWKDSIVFQENMLKQENYVQKVKFNKQKTQKLNFIFCQKKFEQIKGQYLQQNKSEVVRSSRSIFLTSNKQSKIMISQAKRIHTQVQSELINLYSDRKILTQNNSKKFSLKINQKFNNLGLPKNQKFSLSGSRQKLTKQLSLPFLLNASSFLSM